MASRGNKRILNKRKRKHHEEKEKFRNEQFTSATKSLESQNTFLQNQLLLGQQGAEIEKLKLENGLEEAVVSKRIIISGENLLDAQPKMDTQAN